MAGSTNAFLTWFSQWGQVVYFIAQILFWVAIAGAAIFYALQYKRLVSHKVGQAPKVKPVAPVAPVDTLAE
jgi:hypothetical protein